jgi:hypothetical protein
VTLAVALGTVVATTAGGATAAFVGAAVVGVTAMDATVVGALEFASADGAGCDEMAPVTAALEETTLTGAGASVSAG